MTTFEHVLALLLLVAAGSVVTRWLPWPQPITYVLAGLGAAFLPFFPQVVLDPDIFLLCFLAPLLFYDGWQMPLREFARAKGQIILLATGLVAFTTVGVGLAAHWLVPGLPLAMAFALGAVVSPTDAVAVSAITQRLRVPTRLRIVLEGESLLNDATGLVAFKFALAALAAGAFSVTQFTGSFLLVAIGGLLVGLAVAYGVGLVRDLLRRIGRSEPLIETTLSLLTPFVAYLPANSAGLSGVMAVAAAGLYSGGRDPVRTEADTRQNVHALWTTVVFWLNGLAFVLLGLQLPAIVGAVVGRHSVATLFVTGGILLGATILLRMVWVFPATFLPYWISRRIRRQDERPSWRAVFVGGWAGMRGAVTLAAAMSLPHVLPDGRPLPGREMVIFLAGFVVVGTLLIQGLTMETLIRWFQLREDPTRGEEDRLARLTAVEAGLRVLREEERKSLPEEELAALRHVLAEYEQRLSELGAAGETQDNARSRRAAERSYRCAALVAERAAIDELWRSNRISDDVHHPLQQLLDHEEALLSGRRGRDQD